VYHFVKYLLTYIPFIDLCLYIEPRIITPVHDYSKRPLQLFWFDYLALQAIAESETEMSVLAQIRLEDDESDSTEFPVKSPIAAVAEFKTTPAIHVGYAATWFGLSASGIYMTRKLITRGRG
jgi:surfeit locus 1 family protein